MASISTGGKAKGPRRVDSEVPLLPFIDLLLCCVMFLLMTAVWNQLPLTPKSSFAGPDDEAPPIEELEPIVLTIRVNSYEIIGAAGDETDIPGTGERHDFAALREHLRQRLRVDEEHQTLRVVVDDNVTQGAMIETMDTARLAGFEQIALTLE